MYEIVVGRSDSDRKALGTQGSVFLGRHYVKMGNTTSLSSNIYLDVARTHVVLVSGKRGCFTPNTQVLTDKGYKSIKDFDKLKDSLLTFNKNTKEFSYSNAALLKYKVHGNEKLTYKKIKTKSKISGIDEVYDFTVPITHSFVANEIISSNSGKSYSLGVVAEEMANLPIEVKNKIAVLMIDTMGIFWTMKFPNVKDEDLLEQWNLPKKSLDIKIYTPAGHFQNYKEKGIPTDYSFTINPTELSDLDWCNAFEEKIKKNILFKI